MKHEVGERIKDVREKLGIKQKDFARVLSISAPTLSEMEAGRNKPSFDVLEKLAKQYKINLYYLMFGRGEIFENPLMEFLTDLEEKDMAVRAGEVKRFLEYFGKSMQVQFNILDHFEKMMRTSESEIEKEIEFREKEKNPTGQ